MRLLYAACAALVLGGGLTLAARAGEGSGGDELRKSLKDLDLAGSWVYDDIGAGFAEARKSGKPVLVVFR